jgi:hypothetical protein
MSHKQMPRLGSAIASTILSVFSAVSLVGVDKAQAATLTYNIGGSSSLSFFKVDTSSLTEVGNGYSAGPVSEGRFYGYTSEGQEYNNLAGVMAIFNKGNLFGLQASGTYGSIIDYILPPDEPFGPQFLRVETIGWWTLVGPSLVSQSVTAHRQVNYQSYIDDGSIVTESYVIYQKSRVESNITYTLVNTQPEPVPEPLTAGGTALALAGLSWLKQKKKMAA